MAITKDVGRQYVLSAFIEYTFLTLETNLLIGLTNVVRTAFDIPPNSIILSGEIVVTTAFTGTTVATMDLGDNLLATRYNTDVNLMAAAGTRVALVPTGFKYTEWSTFNFGVTTTVAVATAGAGFVNFEYIIVGRETENV